MHMQVHNRYYLRLYLIETSFSDLTTNRILLQPHQRITSRIPRYITADIITHHINKAIKVIFPNFSICSFGGADGNRTHVLTAIQKLQQSQYYLVHIIPWPSKFYQSNYYDVQQIIEEHHYLRLSLSLPEIQVCL